MGLVPCERALRFCLRSLPQSVQFAISSLSTHVGCPGECWNTRPDPIPLFDGRTTRHPGYAVSQQKRKRVEEIFGWMKTVGLLWKVKLRGVRRVGWLFTFAAAVYNLVRMRNLVEAAA